MDGIKLVTLVLMVLAQAAFSQSESIQIDGETRTFIAHAPSDLGDNPALIVSMHGMGGTGSQQRSMSGFDGIADREKFVVVYPDGIDNRWDISGSVDVNFILALIDTMAARHNIDRNRVYASGFSMGGMMSYKLACSVTDKIAAIGPCAGYPMGGSRGCNPSRPMPILHIHGAADGVVDYSGLAACVDYWVEENGCPTTAEVTEPYPESDANSAVTKEYYGPCDEGSEIIVLTVEGMDHAYPGSFGSRDINASEEYWEFFKKHSLSGVEVSAPIATSAKAVQHFTARYTGGGIHLSGATGFHAVRVVDVHGRSVFSWKSGDGAARSLTLPVGHSAGGMYLITIEGREAMANLKVVAP